MALPASSALPPPEADHQPAVLLPGQRDALAHGLDVRLAGNREGGGAEAVLAQQGQ